MMMTQSAMKDIFFNDDNKEKGKTKSVQVVAYKNDIYVYF